MKLSEVLLRHCSVNGKTTYSAEKCLLWKGSLATQGYGRLKLGGKAVYAHRAAYEEWVGPIPDGMLVLHSCDVRGCINPLHLSVGTHRDNMSDMVRKGRSPRSRGERNGGGRKLTESQVVRILRDPRKRKEIAADYGVSVRMIGKIRARKLWAHITP